MRIQDADLRLLKVFIAVVESGSFAGAQSALNICPSTISDHMSTLESRLGFRLCHRGRGGFQLTEEGQKVYCAALKMLTAVEQFCFETNDFQSSLSGEVRLGLIDNTITDENSPLRKALKRFTKRKGQVELRIEICSPTELQQRILASRLHIGIGVFPTKVSGLDFSHLYDEEHRLYCGQTHSQFGVDCRNIALIKECRVVARNYLHAKDLQLLDIPVAAAVVDNVEAQALLILSGNYIGFLPTHYADRWVRSGELHQMLRSTMIHLSQLELIVKTGAMSNKAIEIFINDIQDSLIKSNCEIGVVT